MRTLRACFKFLVFAILCLLVIPTQSAVLLFTKGPKAYIIPDLWHKAMRHTFQIKVKVSGTPNKDHQTLYMSNHLSYLDIPMMGSMIKASFLAKSEVSGWAVFGFLATLQQTAFIVRKRSRIAEETNSLQSRIDRGDSLIVFPEGTSTSGFSVAPFKSSLFMLALGEHNENLYIQPITIKVLEVDGKKPATKEEQDVYAWPVDMEMELHHHLWRFAKTSGATIELTFHEPLRARDYDDRKVLAKACHDAVGSVLENNA